MVFIILNDFYGSIIVYILEAFFLLFKATTALFLLLISKKYR